MDQLNMITDSGRASGPRTHLELSAWLAGGRGAGGARGVRCGSIIAAEHLLVIEVLLFGEGEHVLERGKHLGLLGVVLRKA